MNRFVPETWLEALLRPVAMAFPDAWVYIEVMAPDLRFLLLLCLLLVVLFSGAWKKTKKSTAVLLAFVFVSFGMWLVTTGNGRYFIPVLLMVGVLCVAVIRQLNVTKSLQFTLVTILLVIQGGAVSLSHPWDASNPWSFFEWKDDLYFPVDIDEEGAKVPATYVTLSVISYSLIAPQFPKESRWLNISALLGSSSGQADVQRGIKVLEASEKIRLLMPYVPMGVDQNGLPSPEVRLAIDKIIRPHRLKMADRCRIFPSKPFVDQSYKNESHLNNKAGFWVCDAFLIPQEAEHREPISVGALEGKASAVYRKIEAMCPRLFPRGMEVATAIPGGFMRHYQAADMKVYVLDDGHVYYKFLRAINPVLLGTAAEILSEDFGMKCDSIRGRSGLPWNREI